MPFGYPSPFSSKQARMPMLRAIAATIVGISCTASPLFGQTKLTLHDAIEKAQSSPSALITQYQVDAVRGQVRQAGLRPNPKLYLQSEDLRPWGDTFSFPDATEDYAYVGQTIELNGKRSKRLSLANANLMRTEAERSLQLQQLAGRVAAGYWNAAAAERIRQLLEKDLADVDDMVRYHKERVDAGAMRGVDLLRMQIERDRLMITLEAARREAVVARVELARQIGQPLGKDVELADPMEAPAMIPRLELATVLTQRGDVTIAQDVVAAAEADVKLQKAIGRPDVDFIGGYKRNTGQNTLYTGLQMPLTLWNRNQGEVQRAQASLRIAQAQLQQVWITVEADIAAATETYNRQQDIVQKTLPEMQSHARQNLAIMSDAYKTGGVDLLRYIDAERTEIDVEVNALRTLSEYQQAAIRLQLAYGVHP
ncbi:TolC family protein [soil metagenome]